MTNPTEPTICPSCGKGSFVRTIRDHTVSLPEGLKIVVPDVELEVCDFCHETSISLESSIKVQAYVDEQNELLVQKELVAIREKLGVDQTEMSEILGLGGKTYHRWEKGHQIPSRSMGYYLRILSEFPDAFSWLRSRAWRNAPNIIHVDFKVAFPGLAKAETAYSQQTNRSNPAKALFCKTCR